VKYFALFTTLCFGIAIGTVVSTNIDMQDTRQYSFNQLLMLNDQSNSLINQQLEILLTALPNVTNVRVGLIHGKGTVTRENFRDFDYDVVNFRAAKGANPGELLSDQPLSDWVTWMDDFFDNQCMFLSKNDVISVKVKERLQAMHASILMGCPIFTTKGVLIGGIFATWSDAANITNAVQIEEEIHKSAAKIYNAIEIRLDPLTVQ
jgi:hypothetical protein